MKKMRVRIALTGGRMAALYSMLILCVLFVGTVVMCMVWGVPFNALIIDETKQYIVLFIVVALCAAVYGKALMKNSSRLRKEIIQLLGTEYAFIVDSAIQPFLACGVLASGFVLTVACYVLQRLIGRFLVWYLGSVTGVALVIWLFCLLTEKIIKFKELREN